MSDCSTQAMTPKERRTCGNCNNCDFFDMECSYIEEDGTHRTVTMDTPACADWERRILTDEERYERLEQVALWMYDTMRDFCAKAYADEAEERLKQCGVSVDD